MSSSISSGRLIRMISLSSLYSLELAQKFPVWHWVLEFNVAMFFCLVLKLRVERDVSCSISSGRLIWMMLVSSLYRLELARKFPVWHWVLEYSMPLNSWDVLCSISSGRLIWMTLVSSLYRVELARKFPVSHWDKNPSVALGKKSQCCTGIFKIPSVALGIFELALDYKY